MFDVIVAGSHLRYDGVWQRPQHVLTRLGRRVEVLLVEEQFGAAGDVDGVELQPGVAVLRPARRAPTLGIDGATLAAVRRWCAGRRPLLWLYTPMMLALADEFPDSPLVYDCMDDLSAFAFAPTGLVEREAALVARAEVVFAGGRTLYRRRAADARRAVLAPSGVEFERFNGARGAPHPALASLKRPIFGYFGVVDERIDLAILAELGSRAGSTVVIGPTAKIDPATLPRSAALHYTGQVDYGELPHYLAAFDVAIMPFARNAATASISPTKTLEFLAGAKPVVSTPIADVVADYRRVVRIASTPVEFAAACAREAESPDPARIAFGVELARLRGWDSIVDRMWSIVAGSYVPFSAPK